MAAFTAYTIIGLSLGAVFSLAALGIVLIYRTTGVLNFAHGAMGMFSTFVAWQIFYGWSHPGWPGWLQVAVAVVAGGRRSDQRERWPDRRGCPGIGDGTGGISPLRELRSFHARGLGQPDFRIAVGRAGGKGRGRQLDARQRDRSRGGNSDHPLHQLRHDEPHAADHRRAGRGADRRHDLAAAHRCRRIRARPAGDISDDLDPIDRVPAPGRARGDPRSADRAQPAWTQGGGMTMKSQPELLGP